MLFHPLKPGATIGFFSPSVPGSVTAPRRFSRAKAFLEEKGFRLEPGRLTGRADVYRSGSARERAGELNALLADPGVDAVISTIGGINSNALLPHIDYDLFRRNPKIIIGHSDVTSILLALYAKTGISTFYGPALIHSFGEFPPFRDMTWGYFREILMGSPEVPYQYEMPGVWTDEFINWEEKTRDKVQTPNQWVTVNPGRAEGTLVGGTLNAMSTILGTPYMPSLEPDTILFIEDTTKTAAYVERLFSLLLTHGIFDRVSGIILGKHEQYDDQKTGKRPHGLLMEMAGDLRIPVLAEVDCCHTHPCFTLPLGKRVFLDAGDKQICLTEPWLET